MWLHTLLNRQFSNGQCSCLMYFLKPSLLSCSSLIWYVLCFSGIGTEEVWKDDHECADTGGRRYTTTEFMAAHVSFSLSVSCLQWR